MSNNQQPSPTCPECGAPLTDGLTCQDHFYQMEAWEMEHLEELGRLHHLMVLSYHLQHPSLYSPDGLTYSKGLLVDFLERGITPQQVRQRSRDVVNSKNRKWKIKGTPESHGAYPRPVPWTMYAGDVVAGGMEHYLENIQKWAESIRDALRQSGNLE